MNGADRDQLDPILDACVVVYKEQLDEDGQVDFKGKAKAFERAYGFLASILPYTHAEYSSKVNKKARTASSRFRLSKTLTCSNIIS